MKKEYDMIVLGGGSAGLVVAIGGAALGAKVLLIEKTKIGGDCTHYGCVPSKTLLHSAKLAYDAQNAKNVGVNASVTVDFKKVISHVQSVISDIYSEETPEKVRKKGVDVIIGSAKFVDRHTIEVDGRHITSKKFSICTGSRAFVPPIDGIIEAGFLTNHDIFSLHKQPKKLFILGGGPIGVEMAQAFCRLGSQVVIAEMNEHILAREDNDLALELQGILHEEGVEILVQSSVVAVKKTKQGKEISVKDNKSGKIKTIIADDILVATGRAPNLEGLGLDEIGVAYDKRKLIVNDRLQTSVANIYAAGDVTGRYLFTHVAAYEAGIVLRNALFHMRTKVDYSLVPWTTFCDPELAHVGLRTDEGEIVEFPFSLVDRSHAQGNIYGKVKVRVEKEKIVGVSILGENAGELIHEWIFAMKNGMKLSDINDIIHVYPTLSLVNKSVGSEYVKRGFSAGKKKLLKFLFGLRGQNIKL